MRWKPCTEKREPRSGQQECKPKTYPGHNICTVVDDLLLSVAWAVAKEVEAGTRELVHHS